MDILKVYAVIWPVLEITSLKEPSKKTSGTSHGCHRTKILKRMGDKNC